MSAFSFQPTHHFPLDPTFMPKNTTNMSHYLDDESNISNTNCTISQFYHPQESVQDVSLDNNSSKSVACSDNDPSVTKKQNTESNSSVVDMLEKGEQVTQRVTNMDKKRKNKSLPSLISAQSKDNKEEMSKKPKKNTGIEKNEQEKKPKSDKKVQKRAPIEPPTGYIHVRARRGQATDSHSLAERVRREKISERMKVLQSLVPGCEKVAGKALVLDEIINYVQSLQNQVEFLSMKLASMDHLFFDFGTDLDTFTLDPQRMDSMSSLPQCSPTQPISTSAFTDSTTTTTLNTTNNYPLLDSSSLLLQQGQRPQASAFSQDGGSLVWDVLDQRQKFLNPSDFANNLCSFH